MDKQANLVTHDNLKTIKVFTWIQENDEEKQLFYVKRIHTWGPVLESFGNISGP